MRYTTTSDYIGYWRDFKHKLRDERYSSAVGLTGKNAESFARYSARELSADEKAGKQTEKLFGEAAMATAIYATKFCKIRHIFLAPGVAKFCQESVSKVTTDYLDSIPHGDAIGHDYLLRAEAIAIHAPQGEIPHSAVVLSGCSFWGKRVGGKDLYVFLGPQCDSMILVKENLTSPVDTSEWWVKLAFGVFLYMAAFPELVIDPDVEVIAKRGLYMGTMTDVEKSDIIDEENAAAVSPHFRRGHFRFLQSDRYKKKRFQSVFVKGCFVRGTAKDVKAIA